MPGVLVLEGDRIERRTVEAAGIDFLQAGMNNPEVRPYTGAGMPYNRRRYE